MNIQMLSRQADMMPASTLMSMSACIIGAGTVGSHIAHMLVHMGVPNITVYDHDTVEEVNLGAARYSAEDLGQPKVEALMRALIMETGTSINAIDEWWEGQPGHYDLVIVAPDRMAVRQAVWENNGLRWNYLFDCRTGGPACELWTVEDSERDAAEWYTEQLYVEDVEMECGERSTVFLTQGAMSAMVGTNVYRLVNDLPIFRRFYWNAALGFVVTQSQPNVHRACVCGRPLPSSNYVLDKDIARLDEISQTTGADYE